MAREAAGQVVELAVGTGRIAIAVALAGFPVIGVDASDGMLNVCRREAQRHGVGHLLDLRLGDLRNPPIPGTAHLVMVPFRSYLHLATHADRLTAFRAVYQALVPGGLFAFDVFCPSAADIEQTHGRWLEGEPGIWERALWRPAERRLALSVRGQTGATTMELAWLEPEGWRGLLNEAGFRIEACYGWFDRRPFAGGEDTVWLARRPETVGAAIG
ncbi:MAG: class I SAM-dependent methyltransferase [Actinomycetia bacterium]|nr:class I SAM-dependent methyltransferase [Actinomycetes bacterium]